MLKVVTDLLSFIVIVQLFLCLDLEGFFRTTPGLFGLWIHLFYFIILDSTCSFLSSEMELFMAMVSDVNSVTIAKIALS